MPLTGALDLTDLQRASAIPCLLFLSLPSDRTSLLEAGPLDGASNGFSSDNRSVAFYHLLGVDFWGGPRPYRKAAFGVWAGPLEQFTNTDVT